MRVGKDSGEGGAVGTGRGASTAWLLRILEIYCGERTKKNLAIPSEDWQLCLLCSVDGNTVVLCK